MIRINVINEVLEKEYDDWCSDMKSAEEQIARRLKTLDWGKPERVVHEDHMSEVEKTRVMHKEKGADGKWLCTIKSDYIIKIYKVSDYADKRRSEYPSMNEILEAIVENMELRPEKLDKVKAQRAYVRNKYPKDETELLETR